jgi:hypothetical protein
MTDQRLNSLSISKRLAIEFVGWYDNLMRQGKSPPNAFTGVRTNGKQFVCLLSPLGLERKDQLDFMVEVLRAESCTAFAHSTRVMREDGIECIDIFSGEDGEYWAHEILFKPEGPVLEAHGPDRKPTIFFHELLKPEGFGSIKKDKLLALWNNVKDQIMWR